MQYLSLILLILASLTPTVTRAQTDLIQDIVTVQRARVQTIASSSTGIIPGTQTPESIQTIVVEILDGVYDGSVITFTNDYIQLKEGDTFYARHVTNSIGSHDMWSVATPDRLPVLIILGVIFLALIIYFGGIQGTRGFASLMGSILLIIFVLVPGILGGFSPLLVSVGVASIIIVLGSYITHGFNRTTSSAVLGMILTVGLTGALGWWAVHAAQLSGFNSEESTYLNLNTAGGIDLVGLLFGGIMIGLLGVLYDIAIGQAISVEELFRARAHDRMHVYSRAIRIGREHIGALVNTLAIAYVGAALPILLLLVQTSSNSILFLLSSEIFATEIIRILIGSIGLVLAVPITTYIAVRMLHGHVPETPSTHSHHH